MATAKLRDDHITSAQYNRLINAVSRGEAMVVKAVLDAKDRVGYLSHEQGRALLKACVTAPHAVALLAVVQNRSDQLIRGITSYLGMAFVYASLHRADVATVEYIVKGLKESGVPTLEKDLLWATTTRNVPHVLGAAVKTDDQSLVMQFMGLPAVQAFLASLEATFKPWIIQHGVTHHQPHDWLGQAMAHNMDAVVAIAAERCLLVTAEVALMHCASYPDGATKYADLCARRDWLNRQIETFHQAIQAGNSDVVSSMLEEVPALRRSRMDSRVTALMASALAPNSVALLECLLDEGTSNKAAVQALVHACKHGAAAASIDHLWKWVESIDRDDQRRDRALWEAIASATSHQQVVAVGVLLSHVRNWASCNIRELFKYAMRAKSEAYACTLLEVPVVEAYFKARKDKGYVDIASEDEDSDEDECDCSDEGPCSEAAYCMVPTASYWVDRAVKHGLRRVADHLDKWWPTLTRRAAFIHCYRNVNDTLWSDLSQRFAQDVTWRRTRDVYLVQRRVLPGLDHLGWHIATYLYVFVAVKEFAAHV